MRYEYESSDCLMLLCNNAWHQPLLRSFTSLGGATHLAKRKKRGDAGRAADATAAAYEI